MWKKLALVAALTLACTACNSKPTINNAADLTAQLQRSGLNIESQEQLPKPKGRHFRWDEGVGLNGPDLRIEIIRIDDEKIYKIAVSAGVIIALGENEAGQRFPGRPDIYYSQPYMIVVRQEPQKGQVQAALQEIVVFDE